MAWTSIIRPLAAAAALVGASAGGAAAQGQGYGVGEWNLVTQGGASVCNVVLTNRFIPDQANFRAFVRPDARCSDWRARGVAMWVVRGNELKLSDGAGRVALPRASRLRPRGTASDRVDGDHRLLDGDPVDRREGVRRVVGQALLGDFVQRLQFRRSSRPDEG